MKAFFSFFIEMIARPGAALASLAEGRRGPGLPLLLFAAYAAAAAALSQFLPPELSPSGAQARSFFFVLSAGAASSLAGAAVGAALIAFFRGWLASGRPGLRVPASIAACAAYFFAVFLAQNGGFAPKALLAALPLLPAAAAALRNPGLVRGMFLAALATNAAPLALFPLEAAAALLPSKGLYEGAAVAAALWTLWLLARALALLTGDGAARSGAAAFFGAVLSGIFIFALGFLFSKDLLGAALLF